MVSHGLGYQALLAEGLSTLGLKRKPVCG